jgi:DNA-binding beta-propeller fold protein YncE
MLKRLCKWLVFALTLLGLAACAVAPTTLLHPNSVAVAADGSLFVMDGGNNRVVHFSASGSWLGSFSEFGTGPAQIYRGWGLTVEPTGNVLFNNIVSNDVGTLHEGIKEFAPDGRLITELMPQDYDPTNPDEVVAHLAYSLNTDSRGRIYIADYNTNTVRVLDAQGQLIAQLFGEVGSDDGQFNGVGDVVFDEQRGWLYVVDFLNQRVQQFTLTFDASGVPTATFHLSIGEYGRGPGQLAYPQNIAVNPRTGDIYVSDLANRRIEVFDADGQYRRDFAPTGVEDWQTMGLRIGPDEAVYVADARNNAIWVFEPDGQVRRRIGGQP